MNRHFRFASSRVTKFAAVLGLFLCVGAGKAQAASLVEASDVWGSTGQSKNAKPAFMTFDSAHNGLWTANAGSNTVSLRDAATGQNLNTIRVGKKPTSLALDATRNLLWVVNSEDNVLFGIDTNTDAISARISTGKGAQLAAVDAKTGTVFVANCDDNTVTFFNPDSLQLGQVKVGRKPFGVAVDSTRRRVYVANYGDDSISVIDADSHRSLGKIEVAAKPITVAVDATSGTLFVTHSESGTVGIISSAQIGESRIVELGGYPLGLNIDSQRGRVYVADYDNQKLRILDTNGNGLDNFDVAPSPTGLAFNAQTGRVFICSEENSQLDVLDLQATVRPTVDAALLNRPSQQQTNGNQKVMIAQTDANTTVESESPNADGLSNSGQNPVSNFNELPVATAIEDTSVQRFATPSASDFVQNQNSYGYTTNTSEADPSLTPPTNTTRVRRPIRLRPQFQTPGYEFEEAPAGGLGNRIAQEAQKLYNTGASSGYHHQCDRLADTTIRRATHYFDNIVGPNPGDTAAKTMSRFQNAGIGTPYSSGMKLRAGDILYSGTQVGGGCGHVMIVGQCGKIFDQYGSKNRPTTRPQWVVRPDDAVRFAAR